MGNELITRILDEAIEIYNSPEPDSYPKFINYLQEYNPDSEKGKIAQQILEYMKEKNNKTSSLIFEINSFYREEILMLLTNKFHLQI